MRSRPARAVRGRGVEWLWPGRFAFGHVHVFDGDPGLGKSTIALDIAARLSRGLPMPAPPPPPAEETPSRSRKPPEPEPALPAPAPMPPARGGSIVLSAEDQDETAIQPRLVAAGADLDRIELVDEIAVPNPNGGVMVRPVLLPDDVLEFERLIGRTGARLLIVDPIMAFIGHDRRGRQLDAHKDQSIRQMMYTLRRLAERTGVCIVLIRHLSKSMVASALRRGLASIGIAAAARVVLMAADYPKKPGVRALAGVKTNLGFMAPTLAYRIVSNPDGAPQVEWLDDCDYSADDLLRSHQPQRPGRQCEAEEFLTAQLRAGPKSALEVLALASLRGLSGGTLDRAAKCVGVMRYKKGKQWVWEMSMNALRGLRPLN